MIIDCGTYRIVPYPGNTCWCIQKRAKSSNAKNQWHKARYYPSTVTQAIAHVLELQLKEEEVEIGVEEAAVKVQEIVDNLLASVAAAVGEKTPHAVISVDDIEGVEDEDGFGEIIEDIDDIVEEE